MEQWPTTRGGEIEESVVWITDSEPAVISSLSGLGIENIKAAFKIDKEKDNAGNDIESIADIYWVKFSKPKDYPNAPTVEGKLYIPKNPKKETTLIHYAASFPPGNAGRFEKHYVYDFLVDGSAFFAGRNNGVSLVKANNFNPAEIINAPKRLQLAETHSEQHLGGIKPEGYSPAEVGDQPITSLSALAPAFQRINLIAQSFGVSANNNAVTQLRERHQEIIERIRNIVSIAGYVGKDSEDDKGVRDGTKISGEQFATLLMSEINKSGFNFSGGVERLKSGMQEVARRNEQTVIPPHINYVLFITPKDGIVGPASYDNESLKDYGPNTSRKIVINDLRMPDGDMRPHSMDWITAEELLNAMKKDVQDDGPHVLTLN